MRELRQALLDDPALFILHYFPHRIEYLKDFHHELIEAATTFPRSLILYPAAHGKTTLVSTLLPVWALCRNPNIRIAVIAKNENESKQIARVVMAELLDNEELIRDFGPFDPEEDPNKPWSLTHMTIAGRTERMKEPTIAFFGSGSKGTLGHRTDWTICDDVVTEKNSATPIQRESMRDWFDLSVETMTEFEDSRLTVVGTLFDPEDLYHDLMELRMPDTGEYIYETRKVDAIVDEFEHVTRWPERWPWKRLMAQKAKAGTLNFNKRYRNIAVDKDRMVFKEEYVKGGYIGNEKYPGCLDENYSVGKYDDSWLRYSGFDPAIGTYRGHKFCAHVVLGVGSCALHERCLWVIDLIRDQMTMPQQMETILQQHHRYNLFTSVVEANSYQAGLLDALKERMNDSGVAYKIEPHYTNRQNKPDPELGVRSMSPWFENGQVHIPWANPESRRKMEQFVDELVQWPDCRTTDTVMGFWFAWRAAQIAGPKYKSFNRLHNPRITTWGRHTSRRVVKNPYYT